MKCTRPITVALAAALALIAAPGLAAELATMSVHPGGLSWAPTVEYDHAVVTVSGEGHYLRYEVSAAEALSFDAFDEQGQALPDGQYTYEIVLAPKVDPQLRARQAAMAERRTERAPQILSGSFQIVAGAVVAGGEEEPSPAAPTGGNRLALRDQVIPDDLIVQGSACIGIDCVNNENFGFDTIRMKENNTRIDFTDTSSTAGFPTQDWEIAANDSASGGRNALIFSDENTQLFVIESGNAANALYIDDLARVGFRTSNPVLDLHVATGNTPGLRLEQTSGSGFTAQTWDIAGNEANFFVRDVTGGSLLPFRIRPGAPTSSLDIAATGNVGVGTASPNVDLHILKTAEAVIDVQFKIETNTDPAFDFTEQDSGVTWRFINNNTELKIVDVGTGADGAEELRLDQAGNLRITGQIFTGGSCVGGCDLVFSPGYELPSITEHGAAMFSNRHLPSVGPTPENGPFNLSKMTGGMLNELEKAHIYIQQLHGRLAQQEQDNAALAQRLEAIEALLRVQHVE